MSAPVAVADLGAEIAGLRSEVARLRKIDDERHARVAADMNRRVDVESVLLAVAKEKRGPIEKDEAQRLALKLGVPDWFNAMVAEKAASPKQGGEETR